MLEAARQRQRDDAQSAQNALEALRQRTPPLVWKSARGEYSVEDAAMHRWFEERNNAGHWPPHSPQGDLDLADPAGA